MASDTREVNRFWANGHSGEDSGGIGLMLSRTFSMIINNALTYGPGVQAQDNLL